jgi:hypothetical protein
VPSKYKYLDKALLTKINYLSDKVLKYNRTLPDEVIDALPDDKFFPITFTLLHEHRAGVPCEPHVRCIIAVPQIENVGRQLILDMEMGTYELLPDVELPDLPNRDGNEKIDSDQTAPVPA